MKLMNFVLCIFIFNLSLFGNEVRHFEGSLEYKITQIRKLKNNLNLDGSQIDSLEKNLNEWYNKSLPNKIKYFYNQNGDYKIDAMGMEEISFVIYKYSINSVYFHSEDGTITETVLKNNEYINENTNEITKNILISDSIFWINNYFCKKATSYTKNQGKIEYYFKEDMLNINPDFFKKDLTNFLNNFAIFTKSLPILVKIEIQDPERDGLIYNEHSLINYKEYEIDENIFEIDYSKVVNKE